LFRNKDIFIEQKIKLLKTMGVGIRVIKGLQDKKNCIKRIKNSFNSEAVTKIR
jgi:hypothetical protein